MQFLNKYRYFLHSIGFFCLTFFLCYISSHLRLPLLLSMFWIVNAVIAGLFIRYPQTHRLINYAVCFLAMILNDYFFSGWFYEAVLINSANMLFIAVVAISLQQLWKSSIRQLSPTQVLMLFPVCLIAALASGIWGGVVSGSEKGLGEVLQITGLWISEQLSTSLMILPLILSFHRERDFYWRKTSILAILSLPILFLFSALLEGPGSIALPLPILIWCALVLPIFVSTLVTFLVGILEIMLVYHNLVGSHSAQQLSEVMTLISIRLGVAALVLTPYMVAVTVKAIQSLNQRLEIRANTDFLTQLLSRAGLFEKLQSQRLRPQTEVGLILFDIDYFKSINDNYGHNEGDEVLRELGYILRRSYSQASFVARFGGEEFALVTLNYDKERLYQIAEELREMVALHAFRLKDQVLSITISLGLALEQSSPEESWQTLVTRLVSSADSQLYQSKAGGRNMTTPDWSTDSQ